MCVLREQANGACSPYNVPDPNGKGNPMDLTTKYMGLTLSCPLIASASPLSKDPANVRKLADAGAGALVMHSIFQEQLATEEVALNYYLEQGTERFGESITYFPAIESYQVGPEQYLKNIAAAKQAGIPIIASLNCFSMHGWTDYARQVADAGADGIELNVYFLPTNPDITGGEIEQVYIDILSAVRDAVELPVAMKLSPFFSSVANMAARLDEAGAAALVLFNRFYQPDIDVDALEVAPNLVLSTSDEVRLPLRWMAILRDRVRADLAAGSGVHTGLDAAKLILAGADVVCMTSALLKYGPKRMTEVRQQLDEVLSAKDYASVSEARGVMSLRKTPQPAVFERANYMKTLESWDTPWESI